MSLLLGAASTARRWAIERRVPLRELESSVALALAGYSWGEGSVACAHGELGRDTRVEAPGQRQLCSELVADRGRGAAAKTRFNLRAPRTIRAGGHVSERRQKANYDTFGAFPILLFTKPRSCMLSG